ncbi:MAG: hypothetical protein KJT03_04015, partial [Verrucomicrobiae bacterium]|nr:hypothetical protein [Verrucomicrobiae bacterium]
FAEDEQLYYLDEEGEKVFVDANEIFGISEVMEMAEAQGKHPEEEPEPPMLPEPEEVVQVEVPTPAPEVDKVPSASEDGFLKPQLSDAIVRGEPVPFQMFVPQGWQTRMADGSLDIHFDGHTFFHCSGTTTESDNNTYIRQELNRVLSEYSGFDVARQEVVTMDRKPWAKLQLTNNRGDQILLITHGSKLGCYTVELKGSFEQLNAHRAQLSRILSSFKFPPTTYYLVQAQTEE